MNKIYPQISFGNKLLKSLVVPSFQSNKIIILASMPNYLSREEAKKLATKRVILLANTIEQFNDVVPVCGADAFRNEAARFGLTETVKLSDEEILKRAIIRQIEVDGTNRVVVNMSFIDDPDFLISAVDVTINFETFDAEVEKLYSAYIKNQSTDPTI